MPVNLRLLVKSILTITFVSFVVNAMADGPADVERASPVTGKLPDADRLPGLETLIRDDLAREKYQLSGKGYAVVIVSTGVNGAHEDLEGRLLPGWTHEDAHSDGDENRDLLGVGSHQAGIVARIAPDARIIPAKVVSSEGRASLAAVTEALKWVLDNLHSYPEVRVTAVCLATGTNECLMHPDQSKESNQIEIRSLVAELNRRGVVILAPAGNGYDDFMRQGMAFPAIIPEVLSVGAMTDLTDVNIPDADDNPNQQAIVCAPFSQRLSKDVGERYATDIFAPGVAVFSTGPLIPDDGEKTRAGQAVQSGTSAACASAAGAVLLVQERCVSLTRDIGPKDWVPSPESVVEYIAAGSRTFEYDHQSYAALDVYGAIRVVDRTFRQDLRRVREEVLQRSRLPDDAPGKATLPDINVLQKPLEP